MTLAFFAESQKSSSVQVLSVDNTTTQSTTKKNPFLPSNQFTTSNTTTTSQGNTSLQPNTSRTDPTKHQSKQTPHKPQCAEYQSDAAVAAAASPPSSSLSAVSFPSSPSFTAVTVTCSSIRLYRPPNLLPDLQKHPSTSSPLLKPVPPPYKSALRRRLLPRTFSTTPIPRLSNATCWVPSSPPTTTPKEN